MILETIVSISIGLWVWGVTRSIVLLIERVDELEELINTDIDDEVEE